MAIAKILTLRQQATGIRYVLKSICTVAMLRV